MRASSRSTSACAPTARSSTRPISTQCARGARTRASRGHPRRRDRLHARLSLSRRTSGASRRSRASSAFRRSPSSHEVSPLIKLVGRGDTTVVDAYLSPILAAMSARWRGDLDVAGEHRRAPHVHDVVGRPHRGRLFPGKDAILSGPAGGVVGMARDRAQRRLRHAHRLRHGRHLDRRVAFRRRVRARVRDRGRGRAHARADDADPYRRRRRRLDPAFRRRALSRRPGFGRRQSRPGVLSPRRPAHRHRRQRDGRQADPRFLPEDLWAGAGRAARRRGRARSVRGAGAETSATAARRKQVADGFIRIAVENMANAIKKISVQRGYDVTRYALNCFGGAGGQHACLVADALGMTTVLIHPFSSLLSAYGMGLADIRATRQQAIEEPLRRQGARGARQDRQHARRRTCARSRRPGRPGDEHQGSSARAHALCGHRHGAGASPAGDRSPP